MMKNKSFTLIELLIVIMIIGVLAGAAVPMFSASKDGARIAKARTDLEAIRLAAQMLHADTGYWPTYGFGGAGLVNSTGGGLPGHDCPPDPIPGWKGPYLTEWKIDPWGTWAYHINYYDPTEIRAESYGPDKNLFGGDNVVIVITKNRKK